MKPQLLPGGYGGSKSPIVYMGGKGRVAEIVWQRFGPVYSYLEPFCGSAAMLLERPDDKPPGGREISCRGGIVFRGECGGTG